MTTIRAIEGHALRMRRNIIRMLAAAGSGHPGGSLGLADVYAALFFGDDEMIKQGKSGGILHYDFNNPGDPNRDLLVISNGHTVPVYYAVLREADIISDEEMLSLRKFGSRLQGHPEREMLPWLETTSGPLGEGLSQAAGMAYSLKYWSSTTNPADSHVFVITGDGELNEGKNWEAIMFAAKYNLGNMTAIVDRNFIQIDGYTEDVMPLEDLRAKWELFNWHVIVIDGNNVQEIIDAVAAARAETEKPSVIIANIVPGKGVSYMEHDHNWHGQAPNAVQTEQALRELEATK